MNMNQFISSTNAGRDQMLREERVRGEAFADIRRGDYVQTTVGGRSDVIAIGQVSVVTVRRFTVKFAGETVGSKTPWFATFRRSDGRSVGGRFFRWAQRAKAGSTT